MAEMGKSSIGLVLSALPFVIPMIWGYRAALMALRTSGQRSRRGFLMTYTWLKKVMAISCVGFVIGGVTLLLLPHNRNLDASRVIAIILAFFAPTSAWLYCETMWRRVLVTTNEIVIIRRRGRRKRIRWREVAVVTRAALSVGVRAADGRKIGVSWMLTGSNELARSILEKVPTERVQCVNLLQRLARDPGPED